MAGPSAVVVASRGCGLRSSRHGDHDAGSIQEVCNPGLKTLKAEKHKLYLSHGMDTDDNN